MICDMYEYLQLTSSKNSNQRNQPRSDPHFSRELEMLGPVGKDPGGKLPSEMWLLTSDVPF